MPLHPDLVRLFGNWPARHGPRDKVVGLTRRTALRHIREGIAAAGLDDESPGTGVQKAGAHSLRHSAARHWLTTAGVPLNVVSQWLGHSSPLVTLRTYLAIAGTTPVLLGLFSWTALAADSLQKRRPLAQRTAAWYDKPSPTFVDAIALVRRHLWLASEGFSTSVADPDTQELPVALYHRLVDSLAYAA